MYSHVGNMPPQYRQGVMLPLGPSLSAPPPVPTGMIAMPPPPHFTPDGMPGSNNFSMPQFSGGFPRYPPPPPILAPPPRVSYSSMPLPYFVPPLPEEPPAEVPPPPPPSPPPSLPLDPGSVSESQKLESFIAKSLPPEPLKPFDPEILDNIERVAADVVKKGPRFESIERAKQGGDPKYAFLFESDEGPEASIAHTYYKWRKQTLEAQMGLEANHREGKLLDQEELWQTGRRKNLSKSTEDDLESQAMLDMDMEDVTDDAMLSGKVEMNGVPTKGQVKDIPGQPPSVKLLVTGSGNLTTTGESLDSSIIPKELAMSMNDEQATTQPAVMNMVKPAECKLTGEYRGAIIENYFSDNSDVSGDLEPTSPTLERLSTKATVQEGLLLRPPKKKLSYLPDFSEIDGDNGGVDVGSTALKSSGIKNSEDGLANEDDSNECPVGKCQKQSSGELMDSSSGEDQQSSRKKRKGRSQSRSNSRSPTSSTQRIQSHSGSPAPHADVGKMISNIDEKEGRRELKIMKRGKGGLGFNVCVNYARGRCFRGNSCRFLHQDTNASAQESAVQIEVLCAGSAEQDVEAENKAGDRLTEGTVEMANTNVEKNRNLSAIEEQMPFAAEKASLDCGKEVEKADVDVKEALTSEEGRSKTNVAEKVEEEWSLPEDDDFVACAAWPSSLQQAEATNSLSQNDVPSSVFLPAQTQFLAVSSPPPIPPTTFITSSNTAGNFSCSSHMVTSLHNVGAYMQPGFPRPPPVDASMNFPNRNLGPSQGLHRDIPFSIHDTPPLHVPSMQPYFGAPFPTQSGFSQTTLQGFTPQNQPPSFSSFPQMPPQQRMPSASTSYLPFSKHGSGATAPLSSYTQTFSGDISNPSMFSGASNGNLQETVYPKVPPVWSVSRPYDSTSVSLPGQTSSYSYNLTSIPPLPSIIKLPTSQDLTTSSDQYDPLSDSLDPGPTLPSSYVKLPEPLGVLPTTNAKEKMSSGPEPLNLTETLGDPVVGVEDVSPPDDERTWSPPPVGEEEGDPQEYEAKPKLRKQSAARGLKLLRSAIADHVKELLKPTWKEGRIHKDAFKTIVKKAVDKVTNNLPSHHIPKSQEKVIQFMATSRPKIAKLVQGYIDKYRKA